MSRYRVELLAAARRQLKKLPKSAQKQIATLIDALAEDPRPHGYKPLQGPLKGLFRVRSSDYRIIYAVEDKVLLITVIKIGNRREIY